MTDNLPSAFPCQATDVRFLFVCFVALRPKSTAIVMVGRSVHLTTLFFSWASLKKHLFSTLCTYFRLQLTTILLECFSRREENDRRNFFYNQSQQKYGTGPGSNSRPLNMSGDYQRNVERLWVPCSLCQLTVGRPSSNSQADNKPSYAWSYTMIAN